MRTIASLIFSLLFVISCATSVSYVQLGKEYPALGPGAYIQVYIDSPEEKYEKIALVAVEGGNLEQRVNEARKRAAKVGATGIIMLDELERSHTRTERVTREGYVRRADGKNLHYFETVPEQRTVNYVEQRFLLIRLTKK